jgi:hypothetical protein
MIYLYGAVENCFNNFYVFRGYAKPKDIVRYSEAYSGYQRDLNDEHTQEIVQYFRDGINIFSPEVVLAYSVEDWWDERLNPSFCGEAWCSGGVSPIDYLVNNNSVSKHARVVLRDSLGIQVAKVSTNLGISLNLAKISLPDDLFARPFRRIDGNHRLEAMSSIEGEKADYQIPICIVFLKADFFEGQTAEEIDTAKIEATIFHNINTKQIPLTPEESLRTIIENENMFLDEELRDEPSFGLQYFLARKLLKEVNLKHYRNINHYISSTKYSFFVDLFRCLIKHSLAFVTETTFHVLIERLSDIETTLDETTRNSSNNTAIIGALAYYKIAEPNKYPYFLRWASKNHLGDVNNIHIDDVIEIYDKVYENTPKKVFLARWYPDSTDDDHDGAEHRLSAIRTAIESYDSKLELVDMGTRTTGTFSIREAINQELPISDIFIADLTGTRPNVMVEVGMALKNIPAGRILFYFHPTQEAPSVPFDLSGYQYFLIQDSRDIDTKVIPVLLNILDSIKNGE